MVDYFLQFQEIDVDLSINMYARVGMGIIKVSSIRVSLKFGDFFVFEINMM